MPNLDLARPVTKPPLLVWGEQGDDLIQAALQTSEHLPSLALLSAVALATSHVQRTRPATDRQRKGDVASLL